MAPRGHWCNITVLNVHAPSEETSDDSNDSFYKELQQVFFFYNFPKNHMKTLLGDFNAKVVRENIFKPTNENDRMRVCIRIVMIIMLEQSTLPHQKI